MKNILHTLGLGLFLVISSYFFYPDFVHFREEQSQTQALQAILKDELQSFTFANIGEIEKLDIYVTPDLDLLDRIVENIDSAHDHIYLNTYIFTEKRIREALLGAHKKGIDVKVILEKNVYKSPNINSATYDILVKEGIDFVWSNPKNFSLNHAKYLVVDDSLFISTGNYSYSTFKQNRDVFLHTSDVKIVSLFKELFLSDFAGERDFFYSANTILGSYDARQKLLFFISHARSSIQMYIPYLYDEELIGAIETKLESGVRFEAVTSDDNKESEVFAKLTEKGGITHFIKNLVHAKAILIDDKYLFIGSINFSPESMDKNREAGLLISNKEIVEIFSRAFKKDFIN